MQYTQAKVLSNIKSPLSSQTKPLNLAGSGGAAPVYTSPTMMSIGSPKNGLMGSTTIQRMAAPLSPRGGQPRLSSTPNSTVLPQPQPQFSQVRTITGATTKPALAARPATILSAADVMPATEKVQPVNGTAYPATKVEPEKPKMVRKLQKAQSALPATKEDSFMEGRLTITILGASGDLAKKKTYPAVLELYLHDLLPKSASIIGFARSKKTDNEFRTWLKPFLLQYAQGAKDKEELVDAFLLRCTYYAGAYEEAAFQGLAAKLSEEESQQSVPNPAVVNRLFYFAIPPVAFLTSAQCINSVCMSDSGFTRLIIEKPFGHDLASAEKLTGDLGAIFTEDYIYRIDHYLGKEIIQNAQMFRFGNSFLEPILNHHYVANVRITVKENFGTEGRGGYFTNNGIIRDFMQNHLMQVLTVFAMEPPPTFIGVEAGTTIRNQKVNVIKCMDPINPDQVVCGQYVAADGKPGYLEDDSIAAEDRDKANYCPTFAQAILYVNNARWQGVPFIMKAGKALDERKAEIRVQFKDSPAGGFMFGAQLPRNELVMRLQPDETIYMKVNVKEPGLSYQPVESELDLSYATRYADSYRPDAYIRLILDSLRGNQSSFVRSDELLESWKLWTPLLEHLEAPATRKLPEKYAYNSRGPALADDMAKKCGGFLYDAKYQWSKK